MIFLYFKYFTTTTCIIVAIPYYNNTTVVLCNRNTTKIGIRNIYWQFCSSQSHNYGLPIYVIKVQKGMTVIIINQLQQRILLLVRYILVNRKYKSLLKWWITLKTNILYHAYYPVPTTMGGNIYICLANILTIIPR